MKKIQFLVEFEWMETLEPDWGINVFDGKLRRFGAQGLFPVIPRHGESEISYAVIWLLFVYWAYGVRLWHLYLNYGYGGL